MPELTAAGARRLVDAAVGEAERIGVAVVVYVVDRGGHPLALVRMDGAPRFSVEVAHKKAWTSAIVGTRTADLRDMFNPEPTLLHGLAPKLDMMMAVGGAAPVTVDEAIAGAIGVSGATEDEDQQIADVAAASA